MGSQCELVHWLFGKVDVELWGLLVNDCPHDSDFVASPSGKCFQPLGLHSKRKKRSLHSNSQPINPSCSYQLIQNDCLATALMSILALFPDLLNIVKSKLSCEFTCSTNTSIGTRITKDYGFDEAHTLCLQISLVMPCSVPMGPNLPPPEVHHFACTFTSQNNYWQAKDRSIHVLWILVSVVFSPKKRLGGLTTLVTSLWRAQVNSDPV